jgi:hypothetical protein
MAKYNYRAQDREMHNDTQSSYRAPCMTNVVDETLPSRIEEALRIGSKFIPINHTVLRTNICEITKAYTCMAVETEDEEHLRHLLILGKKEESEEWFPLYNRCVSGSYYEIMNHTFSPFAVQKVQKLDFGGLEHRVDSPLSAGRAVALLSSK